MTITTGRGRKEQYEQYRDWADEQDLKRYTLSAFSRGKKSCPCAAGEHGKEWKETVMAWYHADATPKSIHKFVEGEFGRPLPCQEDGRCRYTAMWDFDPDEYDVLIGHYKHLHNQKVAEGRTVFLDEFPRGAYEQTLSGDWLALLV